MPNQEHEEWIERFNKEFVVYPVGEFPIVAYFDNDSGMDYWRADKLISFISSVKKETVEKTVREIYGIAQNQIKELSTAQIPVNVAQISALEVFAKSNNITLKEGGEPHLHKIVDKSGESYCEECDEFIS